MTEKSKKVKTKRPTALKRDVQNARNKLENRMLQSRIGTAVRNLEKETTQEKWRSLQALLDKAVKKKLFKKNKASRLKSRFSLQVT